MGEVLMVVEKLDIDGGNEIRSGGGEIEVEMVKLKEMGRVVGAVVVEREEELVVVVEEFWGRNGSGDGIERKKKMDLVVL